MVGGGDDNRQRSEYLINIFDHVAQFRFDNTFLLRLGTNGNKHKVILTRDPIIDAESAPFSPTCGWIWQSSLYTV